MSIFRIRKTTPQRVDGQVTVLSSRAAATNGGIWSLLSGHAPMKGNGTGDLTLDVIADWKTHFRRFVNLEPQIELLMAALDSAIATQFEDRGHLLLHGPPGTAKTEMLRTLANLLGQRHCKFFDAGTLTKAGAEQYLLGTARLPQVVILDELDKAAPDAGSCWLQVLDDRAEISKTDGRDGHRQRNAKILVIAAANDPNIVARRLGGALMSRLSQRIFFPPPSLADVQAILLAAADASRIDRNCVAGVLAYANQTEDAATDLRRLLALLRTGRDKWLGEDYPRQLLAMHEQERRYRANMGT